MTFNPIRATGGLAGLFMLMGSAFATPMVAGDLSLASQFLNGNAHVVILGDGEFK